MAILTGTINADVLLGLAEADVISGLQGDDELRGLGGNDEILGGGGNDLIYGNVGNDTLVGGAGADRILGGQGNDLLRGGAGADTLSGGTGNDTLNAGVGNDLVVGGGGSDYIILGVEDNLNGLGADNSVQIQGFVIGEDIIQLASGFLDENDDVDIPGGSNIESYAEVGDAGEDSFTANVISGTGDLDNITGRLLNSDDVDVYQVTANDIFMSFSTVGNATFDTILTVYDSFGNFIAENDDAEGGLQSQLEINSSIGSNYYVAISYFPNFGENFLDDFFNWSANDLSPLPVGAGGYSIVTEGVLGGSSSTAGYSISGDFTSASILYNGDVLATLAGVDAAELSINDSSIFAFV